MIFDLKADELSAYATFAAAIIAVIALVVAFIQVRVSKRESRLSVAKSIYKDYLALAFANPKFSSASYPLEAPRMMIFESNPDDYEMYEYFVSHLLFSAEEVLHLTKNSVSWRATLRDQLRYHALYLESMDFPENHYSKELLTLREEAIAMYKNEQTAA